DSASIGAALASIRAQTVPFDELLIIDDGSTDDSISIINRLIADLPCARLLRNETNRGIMPTLNRGIAEAAGEYIFLASSNDAYHPHIVAVCEKARAMQPGAAIICGNAVFHHIATGREVPVFIPLPQVMQYVQPMEVQARLARAPLTFFGGAVVMRRD